MDLRAEVGVWAGLLPPAWSLGLETGKVMMLLT